MTTHEFLEMLRNNYAKMLLSKKEVAAELGISKTGIDRLHQTGQIMFGIDEITHYLSEAT